MLSRSTRTGPGAAIPSNYIVMTPRSFGRPEHATPDNRHSAYAAFSGLHAAPGEAQNPQSPPTSNAMGGGEETVDARLSRRGRRRLIFSPVGRMN